MPFLVPALSLAQRGTDSWLMVTLALQHASPRYMCTRGMKMHLESVRRFHWSPRARSRVWLAWLAPAFKRLNWQMVSAVLINPRCCREFLSKLASHYGGKVSPNWTGGSGTIAYAFFFIKSNKVISIKAWKGVRKKPLGFMVDHNKRWIQKHPS